MMPADLITQTALPELDMSPEAVALRLDAAAIILARYSGWSLVAGVVPVPVVDIAALAALQAKMVADLARLYEQRVSVESVQAVTAVLLGVLVPQGAASLVTSFLPGLAGLLSLATQGAFSGLGTYTVGRVFVRYFENGGRLHSLSVEAIRRDLQREFAAGRKRPAAA